MGFIKPIDLNDEKINNFKCLFFKLLCIHILYKYMYIKRFLYQKINYINNNNILNLFFFNLKLNFFFKINSKNYTPKDDIFNLFLIDSNHISNPNKMIINYIMELKPFNFDQYSLLILKNYTYFYIYKQYFTNNFFIKYFFKSLYLNKLVNSTLVNFFLFNCCFYNFYIENIFLFYKILSTDKNHFF